MAAVKNIQSVSLRARVFTGTDSSGNPIVKNRSFSNVRDEVTPDDALEVLETLMNLQKHSVYEYLQIDTSGLHQG